MSFRLCASVDLLYHVPGETLFRIVDTEHLKVCFDILENELQRFEKGTEVTVAPVSFIDDRY